jgi:phage terminase large subunit GpA-like protein
MRVYNVPCPHCGEYQELIWEQLKFPDRNPDNTFYECLHCKEPITEKDKYPMIQSGKWIATNPEKINRPGFHLSELYSPWSTWEEMVRDFLDAREKQKAGDHQDMKVFKNTRLALTWDENISNDFKADVLLQRVQKYTIPEGVLYITSGIDVQDDRLECLVVGWGVGEQLWI